MRCHPRMARQRWQKAASPPSGRHRHPAEWIRCGANAKRSNAVATYLFAFNPAIWNWPQLKGDIRTLGRRGHLERTWSCGRHRHIEPGSRAFLVRLGVAPKGIMGSGVTLTAPVTVPHWLEDKAAAGIMTNRVTLRLESLFETPPVVFDELEVPPFRHFRWGVRSSGTYLPSVIADALEDLWETRVSDLSGPAPKSSAKAGVTSRPGKAKPSRK